MKVKRSKNFATILYPESCPSDFLGILKSFKVSFLLSPLHEYDVNSNGELKKPHYHLVLIFDSLKSIEQVQEVLEPVNAVGCEIVNSLVNYGRYLCHLDDKDKYQYDVNDVVSYGYDYSNLIATKADKYETMARILDFCVATKCCNFSRLLLYARQKDFEMFKILCDNSYMIREFLRSAIQDTSFRSDDVPLDDSDWVYSSGLDSDNPFSI